MIPTHVALIMDGNRRWAKAHRLPIVLGHKKGVERVTEIVRRARYLGVTYITFWAFSTENWKRDAEEVSGLMNIFQDVFNQASFRKLTGENAKVVIFGDRSQFNESIQKNLEEVIEKTKHNTGITVNIALNYGGRAEIVRAVSTILKENVKAIDEKTLADYLYSKDQPDPDLIIRTGGEKRLSGYLPWQSVYSELYFTDTYWPDFDETAFDIALEDFYHRQRRFGA